ncbi:MAG: glycosyltransferase [Candidatus Omnitrophica bacterium]|nr:glycosyltransferase [Candidatus Omnitrophota bacterium]
MISVVVPVYNERPTIPIILKRIKNVPLDKEIIVVDDGSTDGTREFLESLRDSEIRVIFHPKNLGKGAALRTGFKYVNGDIIIIQDADLEYYPEEYLQLIKPITDGYADVVYGSRFIGTHRVFLFTHYFGNKILNFIANILYNTNLSDLMTGYKVFKRDVIKNLRLEANGFGIEAEITAEIFRRNLRVYEVPISYRGRTYEEGKKITWFHFFVELYWLIRQKFVIYNISLDTLLKMGFLRNYNRWIFNLIKPYLGKRILEIGAGIGNMTRYLLYAEQLVITDISDENIFYLKSYFGEYENIRILKQDIAGSELKELNNYDFDTIICLNLLEHIKDDKKALMNIYMLMKEDTRFIILSPALSLLMGSLDVSLGHYRRYNKKNLLYLLENTGFSVEKINYFNFLGAFGWFINSRILKKKSFSEIQIRLFDKFVKFLKLESIFKIPFGMSLIAVCKRK